MDRIELVNKELWPKIMEGFVNKKPNQHGPKMVPSKNTTATKLENYCPEETFALIKWGSIIGSYSSSTAVKQNQNFEWWP